MTGARRMLWVIAIGGGVTFVVLRRRSATPAAIEPSWPPLRLAPSDGGGQPASEAAVDSAAQVDVTVDGDVAVPEESARWVAPQGGRCPTTHPIKANANSGIYHVPGGRFYDRTRAERCYAAASEAEADGYRAAKDPAAQGRRASADEHE